MSAHKLLILLLPIALTGQIKDGGEIEPIKPPIEVAKARYVIDHQDITINKVEYVDAKLIYEFKPMLLEKCDRGKLITEINAIKENADKLTVEYQDERLGKMSAVFLGAMPAVTAVSAIKTESGEAIKF